MPVKRHQNNRLLSAMSANCRPPPGGYRRSLTVSFVPFDLGQRAKGPSKSPFSKGGFRGIFNRLTYTPPNPPLEKGGINRQVSASIPRERAG